MSAAQFLNLFLFPPEQQYTYISKLSGGERRRLHLLTILFRNPNFLILDEPTNDLDLPTLTVLENFLLDFQGCLLIVSHDRYFMDKLVDHLFVFEGEGTVTDYPGNYSQYREALRMKEETEKQKGETTEISLKPEPQGQHLPSITVKRKLSYKEQREFDTLEKEIAELDHERKEIYEKLSQADTSYEELQKLTEKLTSIGNLIDQKEMRWLELSELGA
jgi:ATP-binding cassette subfamily F protein uup